MDSWSNIQLARMKNGGNHKLKQFWAQQKFPKNLSPKQRLDNTAMDKYREHLLAKAKGESVAEIAFIGYQAREIASKSSSNLLSSHEHRNMANSSTSSLPPALSNSYGGGARPKMQGFGNTDYNPHDDHNDDDTWGDFWNSTSSFASSFAAKTSAAAADFAQKSKVAATNLSQKASEKAGTLKGKLGDEEYQANLKKNAAETWQKTTNTLSSWWSTAATSVSQAINENLGDAETRKESVKLYHEDSAAVQRKKMAALSSDEYFHSDPQQQAPRGNSYGSASNSNANANHRAKEEDILGMNASAKKAHIDQIPAPFPSEKTRKNGKVSQLSDDFDDDWGFGGDEDDDDEPNEKQQKMKKPDIKQPVSIGDMLDGDDVANTQQQQQKSDKVESLLDFDDEVNASQNGKKGKDGNSSDELDAFFNEMEDEHDDDNKHTNTKKNHKEKKETTDLLTDSNQNDTKKVSDDDNFDWGF
eukprot:CAMPEP_0197054860 /NCGR_PEP_ID=MMETSP1384-20130603/52236_1 /TAXON_ID=29189 /ORGANISM="Ammonia sp." /LENGTH=471 /DNA_ID=CAMNT_0042488199 /DNA_START=220 /DNA_END=1635 /DNA_ORIENTATION=-